MRQGDRYPSDPKTPFSPSEPCVEVGKNVATECDSKSEDDDDDESTCDWDDFYFGVIE